jgi:DNA-directed RNA polymerase subunit K/omega
LFWRVQAFCDAVCIRLALIVDGFLGAVARVARGVLEGSTQAVPHGEVLAVVVVIEQVMIRVVGAAVDDGLEEFGDSEVVVVNGHCPNVDNDIEQQVRVLVHGEQEHVDVVGAALQESVNRVESVAGERRGQLPDVVGLVHELVDKLVMHEAMDPVDQAIREQNERHNRPSNGPPACKIRTQGYFTLFSDII